MDYGNLLQRAWKVVWEHKFLIVLGVLVALGSGMGGGSSSGVNYQIDSNSDAPFGQMPSWQGFGEAFDLSSIGIPLFLIAALVGAALVIALAIWVISTIASGALISGADAADSGEETDFVRAWRAAWERVWSLLGIAILPMIPVLVLVVLGVLGFVAYIASASTAASGPAWGGVAVAVGALVCLMVPLIIVLDAWRALANRACMLEGLGVVESYRRGFRVLVDNFGSALILFLIQFVVKVVMFVVLLVPVILMALCCLFWPVLIAFEGLVTAYFSTLWTLAWREWTMGTPVVADEPLAA